MAVIKNSYRVAGRLVVQPMVLQDMGVHAARREMKYSVGSKHEDAPAPIFGKRCRDIARDGAELIEEFDGLRCPVDRNPFNTIVSSRPDGAGCILVQTANALLVKPRLLAYVDCCACGLPDNSPIVCADP